jgi:hypothetical protein
MVVLLGGCVYGGGGIAPAGSGYDYYVNSRYVPVQNGTASGWSPPVPNNSSSSGLGAEIADHVVEHGALEGVKHIVGEDDEAGASEDAARARGATTGALTARGGGAAASEEGAAGVAATVAGEGALAAEAAEGGVALGEAGEAAVAVGAGEVIAVGAAALIGYEIWQHWNDPPK